MAGEETGDDSRLAAEPEVDGWGWGWVGGVVGRQPQWKEDDGINRS